LGFAERLHRELRHRRTTLVGTLVSAHRVVEVLTDCGQAVERLLVAILGELHGISELHYAACLGVPRMAFSALRTL
jgi:rRNA processing protein Krr1/Pno1